MALEGPGVAACPRCGLNGGHSQPFEIHDQAGAFLEASAFLMRHGTSPAQALTELLAAFGEEPPRRCRQCGCTDDQACLPPCWWVEDDLCSTCHAGQQFHAGVVFGIRHPGSSQMGCAYCIDTLRQGLLVGGAS